MTTILIIIIGALVIVVVTMILTIRLSRPRIGGSDSEEAAGSLFGFFISLVLVIGALSLFVSDESRLNRLIDLFSAGSEQTTQPILEPETEDSSSFRQRRFEPIEERMLDEKIKRVSTPGRPVETMSPVREPPKLDSEPAVERAGPGGPLYVIREGAYGKRSNGERALQRLLGPSSLHLSFTIDKEGRDLLWVGYGPFLDKEAAERFRRHFGVDGKPIPDPRE